MDINKNDSNNNFTNFGEGEKNFKDYINLIRNNLVPVIIIVVVSIAVAIFYALSAVNIYKATTSIKISKPEGSLLSSSIMPDIQSFTDDRFISTEIDVMKSYSVRSSVAEALQDSFKVVPADSFYVILNHKFGKDTKTILDTREISDLLSNNVTIDQKRGEDLVDISVESPSPYEAALIANLYARSYKHFNLEASRVQLTTVKSFLSSQVSDKQDALLKAENDLSNFQAKNGIIALDAQSEALIKQLTDFETQRDDVKIDLASTMKVVSQLKEELSSQNPKIADYLESLASQSYFKELQDGIAKLEVNKELALSDNSQIDKRQMIAQYDEQIKSLKAKLNEKVDVIKAGLFASNPEEISDITKKLLEAEVKSKSLAMQLDGLQTVVSKYDKEFNNLPKTAIEYARLERERLANEKLYSLLEEKYQEAMINEQSQPGNVFIVDAARRPFKHDKPNRPLIVLIGLIIGIGGAFGFVFIKNYFDNTIKTPEDIQKRNINVLAWIPLIEGISVNGNREFEFIVSKKPDSIPSEAFKALRTRVQFSKIGSGALKTILVTSSTPQEGKTTICVNLAGTFAQANKKTVIIDCDLRKPRMHSVFNAQRTPGLIDYLFGQASLEDIIRPTNVANLSLITSGTIPPNPSEMLGSQPMKDFISNMRNLFDVVMIDSAPIIAVTDSEILSRSVDATILVVTAEVTEFDLMEKAAELLTHDNSSFIGTVLNKFSYKAGYGSYYKYYYYYSNPANGKKSRSKAKA